jgi:hypothetical protein
MCGMLIVFSRICVKRPHCKTSKVSPFFWTLFCFAALDKAIVHISGLCLCPLRVKGYSNIPPSCGYFAIFLHTQTHTACSIHPTIIQNVIPCCIVMCIFAMHALHPVFCPVKWTTGENVHFTRSEPVFVNI